MKHTSDVQDTEDYEPPTKILVAVDPVVFTVIDNDLHVLLVQRKWPPFKDRYALPGGFVKEGEKLITSVKRELSEETGVNNIFLKQMSIYDEVLRDPRGRVISIAFLALIRSDVSLKASTDAIDAAWFEVKELPKLAFEHDKIIDDALKQLKYEIQTTNIALEILPKEFTLTELQNLYEKILERKLDKRNFRKKIKELKILKSTGKKRKDGAHRPAELFKFKNQKYTPVGEKINLIL